MELNGILPKFLLCENPIDAEGEEFVLHTREPKILIQILDLGEMAEAAQEELLDSTPHGVSTQIDGTPYLFKAVDEFSTEELSDQQYAELIESAVDWWEDYLDWESEEE